MTEQAFDTSDEVDKSVTLPRSQIKALEAAAKGKADLQKELEMAQRRLAFAEAGLPLGDKRISYFVKGYDGELTTEAIVEAAQEAGFIGESVSSQQSAVEQQIEQNSLEAIQSAGKGAAQPDPNNPEAGLEAAFAAGGTDSMAAYLSQAGVPLSED